jgi:DNA-binding MarR family transcriptional regulator
MYQRRQRRAFECGQFVDASTCRYGVTVPAKPAALTPEQQRNWTTFMRMQELLRSEIEQRLLAHSGLSFADYTVLTVLAGAPQHRMRQADLGAALGWERSRLHHQLTRMCKRGLAEREPMPDAEDGRAVQARLTEQGVAAIREARRRHLRDVRELVIDVLDDRQLNELGDISWALLTALEQAPPRT